MAPVDDLEEQSQQQHQRFYDLFGSQPSTGEGFTDVSNTGRQLSEQAKDTRTGVINTRFSSAVIPALANATSADHQPFDAYARTAATAARVSDASAQVITRGAAAVLANSRNEAAQFAAIPDRDSPEGMIAALNTITANQTKSLETVEQSAAEEQRLGQQAAQGSGDDPRKKNGDIRALDNTTKKGDKDKGDDDESKKGYGGSWSKGKGAKGHVEQRGPVEQQWGHPTNPHEWHPEKDKSGTFDGGRGSYDWKAAPGYQTDAEAKKTSDGISGKAGADGWISKGEAHWSGDVFGKPLDANASGEFGAHANADGTLTDHGISAGGDAFVGIEGGAKGDYNLGPVDLSLGATAQVGAGGSAHLDLGMAPDGKFVIGGTLGATWGIGGKISPHIAVDPKAVTGAVDKAEKWLESLF